MRTKIAVCIITIKPFIIFSKTESKMRGKRGSYGIR